MNIGMVRVRKCGSGVSWFLPGPTSRRDTKRNYHRVFCWISRKPSPPIVRRLGDRQRSSARSPQNWHSATPPPGYRPRRVRPRRGQQPRLHGSELTSCGSTDTGWLDASIKAFPSRSSHHLNNKRDWQSPSEWCSVSRFV